MTNPHEQASQQTDSAAVGAATDGVVPGNRAGNADGARTGNTDGNATDGVVPGSRAGNADGARAGNTAGNATDGVVPGNRAGNADGKHPGARGVEQTFLHKAASAVRGPAGRLPGLDVARALAIFGMVFAHIGGDTAQLWFIPDGFPSGLFAVLAGASMSVMMERGNRLGGPELAHARHRLLLRGALIFGIGMVLDLFSTTIVVVLTSIAIIFLFLHPVTRWRTRNVILLALAWTLLGPALVASSTFFGVFSDWLTSVYPVTAWMVYGLVGVLLHRFLVAQRRVWMGERGQARPAQGEALPPFPPTPSWRSRLTFPVTLLLSAAIAAAGVWLRVRETSVQKAEMEQLMAAMEDKPDMDIPYEMPTWGEEFLTFRAHSGGLGDVFFTSSMAVAVVLLCTLLCQPRVVALVLYPIRSLGAMSLTSYISHVVTAGLFTGIPLLPMLGEDSAVSPVADGGASYSNSVGSAVGSAVPADGAASMSSGVPAGAMADGAASMGSGLPAGAMADGAASMGSGLPAGAMAGDGNWWNVVITIGVLLVFASVWRLFFQRGPVEAAVAFVERRGLRRDMEPRVR